MLFGPVQVYKSVFNNLNLDTQDYFIATFLSFKIKFLPKIFVGVFYLNSDMADPIENSTLQKTILDPVSER